VSPKLEEVFGVSSGPMLSYINRDALDGPFLEALKADKQIIVYGSSKEERNWGGPMPRLLVSGPERMLERAKENGFARPVASLQDLRLWSHDGGQR
jgi:hypothetical protein